ncbi:putative late blight resistance protein homolog R1B-17 [Salvia miltiorrhiza]|uniref:putative late blight resistance protein homolog R1B-17 n=1 Tax=Salvia miltiorrhiza TaxID=226208 RepID=UPI0025ABD135|nr:putative late blight resistance protein homolog R1B-17 [Salvia miltiorrhiza]
MDRIMRKGAELKEKWLAREEQATHGDVDAVEEKQPLTTTGKASPVGLEDDVIHIMEKLTIHQPDSTSSRLWGWAARRHFDIRAWATVSQQYSAQEIFSKLLHSSIGQSGSGNDLGLKLHHSLCGRRYLVLDDIWSVEAWDEVRRYFPDNGNGSRIVLTTRLSDVASGCGSSSCFNMKPLDEDQSWVLFCRNAFQQEHCSYPQLESVGNEIVTLCRGVPLSIVVIGGFLLKSPRAVAFWEDVAKNIKSIPNSKEKQEILDVLSLSYNHLPPHLKPCFLYMGILRRTMRFVHHESSNFGYRYNGKIRSCRLHDLIRDLCLKVSEKDKFFYAKRALNNMTKERRFICHDFIESADGLKSAQLLRSLVCGGSKLPVVFKLLRVLTVAGDCSAEDVLQNLNLRCLTFLPLGLLLQLPSSISFIWNLQT